MPIQIEKNVFQPNKKYNQKTPNPDEAEIKDTPIIVSKKLYFILIKHPPSK